MIKLSDIDKEYIPSLESVRKEVEKDIYNERASKKMTKVVDQAYNLAKKEGLKEVSQKLGGSFETIGFVTEDDIDKIKNKDIPFYDILQLEKKGSIGKYEGQDQFFIVRLDEMDKLNKTDLDTKKAKEKKLLDKQQLGILEAGFVASLYRNAIIKTNESIFFTSEDNIE